MRLPAGRYGWLKVLLPCVLVLYPFRVLAGLIIGIGAVQGEIFPFFSWRLFSHTPQWTIGKPGLIMHSIDGAPIVGTRYLIPNQDIRDQKTLQSAINHCFHHDNCDEAVAQLIFPVVRRLTQDHDVEFSIYTPETWIGRWTTPEAASRHCLRQTWNWPRFILALLRRLPQRRNLDPCNTPVHRDSSRFSLHVSLSTRKIPCWAGANSDSPIWISPLDKASARPTTKALWRVRCRARNQPCQNWTVPGRDLAQNQGAWHHAPCRLSGSGRGIAGMSVMDGAGKRQGVDPEGTPHQGAGSSKDRNRPRGLWHDAGPQCLPAACGRPDCQGPVLSHGAATMRHFAIHTRAARHRLSRPPTEIAK